MCRKLNAQAYLQNCLGNQAGILRKRGQLRDALAMLQEKEAICRNIQNWHGVLVSLVNEGDVYARMGDARRQVERLTAALEVARQYGFNDIARELAMMLGR
jgi:ATP/maltotriose-dependent transcriptional regulator MalT